jgi:hypothetical protein
MAILATRRPSTKARWFDVASHKNNIGTATIRDTISKRKRSTLPVWDGINSGGETRNLEGPAAAFSEGDRHGQVECPACPES